eukprot:CAMPEP_0172610342 /NCGR_PEP_ID=MMETSP1068-20121228/30169_1 /TAXON_ID=35684 /ORGANISM="Pseudopedinella elastica, Strain CCMP716" /LENGTH=30 /DNA_ID= /DNA_START= /DNA_END= /DNA_ORIENTATION=
MTPEFISGDSGASGTLASATSSKLSRARSA